MKDHPQAARIAAVLRLAATATGPTNTMWDVRFSCLQVPHKPL